MTSRFRDVETVTTVVHDVVAVDGADVVVDDGCSNDGCCCCCCKTEVILC